MAKYQRMYLECPFFEASCSFFIFPGYRKYFASPIGLRKDKANENSRCSALESAVDVVSSRKKSLTPACTSTGTVTVTGVTLREHGRPLTRSKGVILSCYLDSLAVTLEQNCELCTYWNCGTDLLVFFAKVTRIDFCTWTYQKVVRNVIQVS